MRRPGDRAALAALTLVLAAWAAPAAAGTPDEEEILRGRYVETLEVSMVLLQATVLDKHGEIVRGLGPADFKLSVEGAPRSITAFGTSENQPLQLAFLLDVSGSMGPRDKLERSKEAIRRFVAGLHVRDQIALMIFADGKVVVKKGLTRDRWEFFRALDPLEAYGQTALRDALASAPAILDGAGPGRKALILITDGVDNASRMTVMEAIQTARQVPVPIYAIAMSDLPGKMRSEIRPPGGGRSIFEILAEFGRGTGGTVMPVFSEDEMDQAVALVERRLRGQYLIGFNPAGEGGEGFRRIQLTTKNRAHQVVTREGYYTTPVGGQ